MLVAALGVAADPDAYRSAYYRHMHGYALEYLAPALKPGAKGTYVAATRTYLTAVKGRALPTSEAAAVGETGKVVGIDHMDGLVKLSIENTKKHHADLLASGRVKFVTGDGRLGYPEQAPYDCIISALFGGQQIKLYKKDDKGNVESKGLMEVAYVPLTDPDSQY
ncbi:Protein-L-isoaspartate(D-aspartate) O-methyltransferase [Spiromyces aspiralis]|uniref:Protein-L-isoaspartate(D-aspartate) O-methyltransferase n=1 Tax=Spiromyces aspiralis TaxID=68401 RepID=A0ACC1HTX4_9FUNG|nr:Protein-L-isoaspartate(D-aspartate) O-methyltransferase [Spiromyces aspiralis]